MTYSAPPSVSFYGFSRGLALRAAVSVSMWGIAAFPIGHLPPFTPTVVKTAQYIVVSGFEENPALRYFVVLPDTAWDR
jgi:hypothetical protein